MRELLEKVLPLNQSFENYFVESKFPAAGPRRMMLNARRIISKNKHNQLILLAMELRVPGES